MRDTLLRICIEGPDLHVVIQLNFKTNGRASQLTAAIHHGFTWCPPLPLGTAG